VADVGDRAWAYRDTDAEIELNLTHILHASGSHNHLLAGSNFFDISQLEDCLRFRVLREKSEVNVAKLVSNHGSCFGESE